MPCDIHFLGHNTTVTILTADKCAAQLEKVGFIRVSGSELAHAAKILNREVPICDHFYFYGDNAREVLANWGYKRSSGYQGARPGATFPIGARS